MTDDDDQPDYRRGPAPIAPKPAPAMTPAPKPRIPAHRHPDAIQACRICDEQGYRGPTVCDHIDRTHTAARGIAACRAALKKPSPGTTTPNNPKNP